MFGKLTTERNAGRQHTRYYYSYIPIYVYIYRLAGVYVCVELVPPRETPFSASCTQTYANQRALYNVLQHVSLPSAQQFTFDSFV